MSRCGPNDFFFFLFVCSVIYFQTVIDCIEDFVSQWCHCPVRGVQERRHFSCSEIGAFLTVVRRVSEGLSTIMCNITTTGWSQPGQDPHLFDICCKEQCVYVEAALLINVLI